MALDLEQLKFCGMIGTVAEKEMSASLTDDTDGKFGLSLYAQYIAAGKPKNKREWIRQELKKHFRFVTKPPFGLNGPRFPGGLFLKASQWFSLTN